MNMTVEEAREEIPTIDSYISHSCGCCTSNDWYCPNLCEELEKAKRIPFEKIQAAYARHDGDMRKVFRYIKQYKQT